MKRIWKYIVSGVVTAVVIIGALFAGIYSTIGHNKQVTYQPSSKITKLYFYRDTCPTCRRAYPLEYTKKVAYLLTGKKIQFINTANIHQNDSKNKRLVEKYGVKQVPFEINVDQSGRIK